MKRSVLVMSVLLAPAVFAAQKWKMEATQPSGISCAPFGKTPQGTAVERCTLKNAQGMEARIATC